MERCQKHVWWACLLVVAAGGRVEADDTGMLSRVFEDEAGAHKYVVYVPPGQNADVKRPVMLYLHSAGERGADGTRQSKAGPGPVLSTMKNSPFILVMPQCEDTTGPILTAWSSQSPDGQRALKILDEVINDFNGDPNHVVLSGWSMGAYGCWSLAAAHPERFSAIVALSGGTVTDNLKPVTGIPAWVFHGATDVIVRPSESRRVVERLKAAGGKPRLTILPRTGHNAWQPVYSSSEVLDWMLNPVAGGSGRVASGARPGDRAPSRPDVDAPFVPAMQIPDAVYVRMGNNMLSALAHSVPERIPKDLLVGRINDIFDATNAEGRTFRVRFSRISYTGSVTRTHVEAYRDNRLNIQLGIQNVHLRIGGASVTGKSHSATTGPISIVIGHRRPVWLSVALEPYVKNRKLKLKLIATRFNIERDNWYVTAPAGVRTRGFGMTREKVSRGLVRGLYGSRGRIENEVKAVVPSILEELEKNLELSEVGDQISLLWPLPVYRPRLRVWPQDVSVDEDGVTLVLGLTAGAVDPANAPTEPEETPGLGTVVSDVTRSRSLELGISGGVLDPLSRLMIDAGVARIHVTDIPDGTFKRFADRSVLETIVPDLKRLDPDTELWSELVLVEPIRIEDVAQATSASTSQSSDGSNVSDASQPSTQPVSDESDPLGDDDKVPAEDEAENLQPSDTVEPGSDQPATDDESKSDQPFLFKTPRMAITIAVRKPGMTEWQPYCDFEFAIDQAARLRLNRPSFESRMLQLVWEGKPSVTAEAEFSPEYSPQDSTINNAELTQLFTECWTDWTAAGPGAQTTLDDIVFGDSQLRADSLGWSRKHLFSKFDPPGVKLTNSSEQPLVYEVKAKGGRWGGPYTIVPGDSDTYSVGYPLTYRRRVRGRYRTYTLPVGSHSEFRIPTGGSEPTLLQAARPKKSTE